MILYEYKSYDEYLLTQVAGYEEKKGLVSTRKNYIKIISKLIGTRNNGLCHGVRTGQEVLWFRQYTKAEVYGTEIGKSPGKYVEQWDFNIPRSDWKNHWDFVYSNSFDHAFSPVTTMRVWADQLKPGGVLIIEHSRNHEKCSTQLDPFAASPEEIMAIMVKTGLKNVKCEKLNKNENTYRVALLGIK